MKTNMLLSSILNSFLFVFLFFISLSKFFNIISFKLGLLRLDLLSYINFIVYFIILFELLTAILLIFKKLHKVALCSSLLIALLNIVFILKLNFKNIGKCNCFYGSTLFNIGIIQHLIIF